MIRKIRHLKTSAHRSHRRLARSRNAMAARHTPLEVLEPRRVLAADPVISEFQASNTTTLQDEDGDFEDWIEIRNPDIADLNIGGWYLTDDNQNLDKWQFPANTVIPAGQHLVVFASNKDRAQAGSQLHTNFQLAADGEFLALVKSDGVTISQSFAPFPAQFEDQSYGLAVGRNVFDLVSRSSNVQVLVPTDDSLGTTWTNSGFDAASWLAGAGGVGYEQLAAGSQANDPFDGPLSNEWTTDIPAGGVGTVNVTNGEVVVNLPTGQDLASDDRGTAPVVRRALPGSPADFELETKVTQGIADRGAAGIVVMDMDTGLPAIQLEYTSRLNFRLLAGGKSQGSKVSLSRSEYSLRIVRDGLAKTWTGYYRLTDADPWTEVGVATDGVDSSPIVANPAVGIYGRTPTSTMTAHFDYFNITIPDQRPVYGPEIGLDVKDAMQNNNSSVYLRMPFTIDGDPSTLDELTLTTRHDDGFIAYLNGTKLTEDNVPIDSTWNSAAASTYGAVNGQIPVRQFVLSGQLGAMQQGQNVLAIHAMNVASRDLDFFFDAQLVASEVLSETQQYFVRPTPGASNELPAAPIPEVMGQQGVFYGSTTVELRLPAPVPTLEIRYTLDGTDPTAESTLYTGPITLNTSAMLQARTFDSSPSPNFTPSNPASGTFMAVDPALQSVSSDLPLMILNTLGQGLPATGSNALAASNVILFDTSNADGRSSFNPNLIDYLGRGGVRDRGSSTAGQPKPNMAFETWGQNGWMLDNDENVGLLGMAPGSDWVLHAPFSFDRALFRNQLAFELSNDMDMWASNYRNIEVYLDVRGDGVITEEDYAGVYVLAEKIEQDPDRVDVTDIDPDDNALPDISGGYIWKIDRADPDAGGFSAGGQAIQWVYPKDPDSRTARDDQKASGEQEQWVIDYFNAFAATLRDNPDINDPEGYSKYINPVTWVDHHMHNVFMMNVDALRLSAYFYKDRNERVNYGPVWDFDRSAESNDDRDDNPFAWRAQTGDLGTDFFGNGTQRWWGDLFQDPGFWQLYVDRWQMWRDTVLSDENVGALVDAFAAELAESAERNAARWSQSRPRASSNYRNNLLDGTFQGEINNLKQWLKDRAFFMDSNFAQRAQLKVKDQVLGTAKGAQVSVGEEVEILPPQLEFYTDTVLLDGTPGAVTGKYFIPGDDSLGTTWTETGFDDAAWSSGPLGYGYDSGDDFTELVKTQVAPNDVVPGSTTALLRIPFEVTDVSQAQANRLILKAKFDDGFVAYLNGQRVADENLRDTDLAWNSRASSRRDTDAVVFQEFDISEFSNLLVEGTNVLSLRAINSSATSNDLLILPELISRKVDFGVNPQAKVYYTTDGTDPRGPDGQPSASATLLEGGGNLAINQNTRVIVRNFDDSFRGTESNIVLTDWSGPIQYDLVTETPTLVVSEINYNPVGPGDGEAGPAEAPFTSDDFEFIEIQNVGSAAVSLIGVKLTDGVEFDFYSGNTASIGPGERIVVTNNAAAFALRYGNDVPVAGQYTGNLDNQGERVTLSMGSGAEIFSVEYGDSDPWSLLADGAGATLELVDSAVASDRQDKWYSWRTGTEYGGTPGAAGAGPAGIVINEVLARTVAPVQLSDSIELHNTTETAIDIGGWYLSDSIDDPLAFAIPAGTVVPAGGYVVFDADDFNGDNNPNGFGLSSNGDTVYLVQGSAAAGVTHFVDGVEFRAGLNGESYGRVPNGSGRLVPLSSNSFGAANATPRVGPLVVSEIQYNPLLTDAVKTAYPTVSENDLEFVEIHNPTNAAVDLADWRLRGAIDFDFASGTSLAAGQSVVVVRFDPADPEYVNELNAFRMAYGIDDGVTLVGGASGQLSDSAELVVLLRPDPSGVNTDVVRVLEDEVLYDDLGPWPINADGSGNSIQRLSMTSFGNDGSSWFGGPATPGTQSTSLPGDLDGNGTVDAADINALFEQMRSPTPDLSFDLNGDSQVDALDRDVLIKQLIGTYYGDANLDGVFNSGDLVTVLGELQYEDAIPGNSTWETGDWNGDGDFTTADLVLAFADGGYVAGDARPTVASHRLIGAALHTTLLDADESDAEPPAGLAEIVSRQRPLQTAAAQSVDSLFAEVPTSDTKAETAEDLAIALLDDGV
jgi:hypothetical protein